MTGQYDCLKKVTSKRLGLPNVTVLGSGTATEFWASRARDFRMGSDGGALLIRNIPGMWDMHV